MLYKNTLQRILPALFIAGIVVFAGLMFTKITPYFPFQGATHFLSTKTDQVLDSHWFLIAFYLHITSSLWVLAGGGFQFVPALQRKRPVFHRWLGKVYVISILLLAAPSGLILAAFANGGLPAKTGFFLQCVIWWLTTWVAWREIISRKWLAHVEWMIRSYAVTLAAISLRTESYLMYYLLETKPIETYLTVTWLSWTGNLLLAEIAIRAGLARWLVRLYSSQITPPAVHS